VRRGLVILSIALLSACAGLGGLSQKPEVSVAGLKLVQVGVFEQRFILKLRVQNPNDVELRINGLSVEVEFNGQPFITGLSDKGVTVPRFGEAVLEVMATSTLGSALKQLRELQKGGRERIDYRIVGRHQPLRDRHCALRATRRSADAGGRQSIAQALASRDPGNVRTGIPVPDWRLSGWVPDWRTARPPPGASEAGGRQSRLRGSPAWKSVDRNDQLVPAGTIVVAVGSAATGEHGETRFDVGDGLPGDVKCAALGAAAAFCHASRWPG
jgi:LEA14-like dessication related protein